MIGSGASGNVVSVKWATAADGTGDHPASTTDYTASTTAQTLSFAAGDTSKTFTVATTNDVYHEENETFLVNLSDPSTGSLIKDGTAIGTITDNDAAPTALTLTVDTDTGTDGDQATIAENGGAKTVQVTATLGGTTRFEEAKTITITIGKSTDTATEGTDYEEVTNQSITIPAYSASASTNFILTPTDDDFYEVDETITIEGTLTGITTITPTAITLTSEDAATKLSIADATAVEGEYITFTVTRSGATGNPVSVKWTTATDSTGDHPAATIDYSAQTTAQTLNFAAGDTSETITIATTDDAFDEETETFLVTLSDPSADTSIDDATAIGTITDNDDAPTITLSVDADTGTEGIQDSIAENGGARTVQVTATLGDTRFPTAQTVAITIGKTGDTATVGTDYEEVTGKTITIPANTASGSTTFILTPKDDDFHEVDETITIEGTLTDITVAGTAITLTSEDAAPIMSINSPTVMEGTNEMTPLNFIVTLDKPSDKRVSVDYTDARIGTATSGVDYVAIESDTLVFEAGEINKTVPVMVINDLINEAAKTVVLRLSSLVGADFPAGKLTLDGTGTITNDDFLPQGWLARFGRTVTEQVLEGIASRVAEEHYPGVKGTFAGLGLDFTPPDTDQSNRQTSRTTVGLEPEIAPDLHQDEFANVADNFNSDGSFAKQDFNNGTSQFQGMTAHDALLGSNFSVTTEKPDGSYSFWGRMSQGRFGSVSISENVDVSLDGKVTTGMLGADQTKGKWLVGIAVTKSSGEGKYSSQGQSEQELTGRIETSLTALVLYASFKYSERLRFWTALGFGSGSMTQLTSRGESYDADLSWNMAALGVRGDLLTSSVDDGDFKLALTSDAMWTQISSDETEELLATDSTVTRFRVGVESSWQQSLNEDSSIIPKLEVGIRYDGGDAETGLGVEVGGSIIWDNPTLGLSVGVSGRTLVMHENNDFKDQGISAWFTYDPYPATRRGPSVNIRQDFDGNAEGGVDTLFNPTPLENRTNSEDTSQTSIEMAYGLPAFEGNYTGSPHVGADLATNSRDYRVGWRLTPEAENTPDFSLDLAANRAESNWGAPDHGVGVEIITRW